METSHHTAPASKLDYNILMFIFKCHLDGVVAEWLRRQIRNLLISDGAGSNPADVEFIFLFLFFGLFWDEQSQL